MEVEPFSYRRDIPVPALICLRVPSQFLSDGAFVVHLVRIFPFSLLLFFRGSSVDKLLIATLLFCVLFVLLGRSSTPPMGGRSGRFGRPFRNCFRFTPICFLGRIFSGYLEPVLFVLSVPSCAQPHDYHNDPWSTC